MKVLLFVDHNFGQVFQLLFVVRSFLADTAAGLTLVPIFVGSLQVLEGLGGSRKVRKAGRTTSPPIFIQIRFYSADRCPPKKNKDETINEC